MDESVPLDVMVSRLVDIVYIGLVVLAALALPLLLFFYIRLLVMKNQAREIIHIGPCPIDDRKMLIQTRRLDRGFIGQKWVNENFRGLDNRWRRKSDGREVSEEELEWIVDTMLAYRQKGGKTGPAEQTDIGFS